MTSLGKTYEILTKFIRFFVNQAPVLYHVPEYGTRKFWY